MDDICNLLAQMIYGGATDDDILEVVKYSREVIDARKRSSDAFFEEYKQLKDKYNINAYENKYISMGGHS